MSDFNQEGNKSNLLIYIIAGAGGLLFLTGLLLIISPMLFGGADPVPPQEPGIQEPIDQTPSQPISPTPSPEPEDECRYEGFTVNVKSVSSDFDDSINLEVGQSFRAYLFEDVDNKEEIREVDLVVEGAGIDEVIESGERIVTEEAGEITVSASFPDCGSSEASVLVVQTQQFSGAVSDGAICGESCNSDSDCISQGSIGVPVECHQGTCVNSVCKDNTVFGTRCECNIQNPCGSPCGAGVGLCAGGSACRFISGPSCTANADPTSPNRTFCVPNALPSGYSLQTCTGSNTTDSYLTTPDNVTVTQALLQQLCGGNNQGGSADLPATNTEVAGINIYILGGIGFILFGLMVLIKYKQS